MDGQDKAAVKDGDVGEELSAGVASGDAELTRECRGVAVPRLWPVPQAPRGPNPQGGQGSHSEGPRVRYYCLSCSNHSTQG